MSLATLPRRVYREGMAPRRVSLHVHRCSCGSPTRLLRGARLCPRCDSPGGWQPATWAQERTHATR